MSKLFISYRRKSWTFTHRLVEDLRARLDATIYVDLDCIDQAEFEKSILPNLQNSDGVLLIVSEHTFDPARIHNDEDWVRREIREAIKHHIPIILVCVDGLLPPPNLPIDIITVGGYQGIEFYPRFYRAGVDALVDFIARIIPRVMLKPTPQTSTAPVPVQAPVSPPKVNPSSRPRWGLNELITLITLIVTVIFAVLQILTPPDGGAPTATPALTAALTTAVALVDVASPTESPTLTPNATELEETIQASMLEIQATANANKTATQSALTLTQAWIETATATQLTSTPTLDIRGTAEARLAQTATQAWIDSWTNTPTPNLTAMTATIDARAAAGVTANADWTPVEDVKDGVAMVLVPAGCFTIGDDNDNLADNNSGNEVCLTPFWLDKTEVTQAQFITHGGIKATPNTFNGDNRPVDGIKWFEARDYCEQRGGRLPTEAEWEFAARGPDGLIYPWGNEFIADNTIYGGNSMGQTANVGSRLGGISWVGALDMSGNVWEWTNSLYMPYPYYPLDGREDGENIADIRVVRGGLWTFNGIDDLRASYRFTDPTYFFNVGFRCARSF